MSSNTAMNNRVHHFKLVLLGDTAVGKSCLVVRFVRDEFFEFQEPTIGAAFLTQTVALDDSTVKFEIWYVAYNERYKYSYLVLFELALLMYGLLCIAGTRLVKNVIDLLPLCIIAGLQLLLLCTTSQTQTHLQVPKAG